VFVIGSVLCGLAPFVSSSIWFLVAMRAIQGVGGGLAQPLGAALLYSAFPPDEQGKALGFFGIALVLAPAMGPLLGGWLVDLNLWQWIFFINLPIGVVGITLASRFLRQRVSDQLPALDPLGLITAVIGFGSVLYGASLAADQGWTSRPVVISFAIAAVSLTAFALIELFVAKDPLLNLRLFKRRNFLIASLVGYVSVLALFGAEFLLPVYLQALRGRTALETGFILLALALAAGVTTPIAGRFYDKIGPRPLVVTGFSLLILNTWQLSQIQADTSIQTLLFLLALRGLALGLTVQTTFATALGSVPRDTLARGSSLINSTRFVIQALGVAFLATVLSSALSPEVRAFGEQAQQTAQPAQETPNAPAAASESPPRFGLCETPGVAPENNVPPGVPAQAAAQIRPQIQQACNENLIGFERAYHVTFYAAILALLLGAMLPGWPFKWAGRAQMGQEAQATAH
jgi:DHA2 family multidrug resistance protein